MFVLFFSVVCAVATAAEPKRRFQPDYCRLCLAELTKRLAYMSRPQGESLWAGPFLLYYLSIVNDFNVLAGPPRNSVSFQPKSVCKVRKNFRTDQTFSRKFLFLFFEENQLPEGPGQPPPPFLSSTVLRCFSKASAKLDTSCILSKFLNKKFML